MSEAHELGVSRERFLARVRAALEREATPTAVEGLPEVDDALVRLASADDDVVTMFAQRADEVGMKVHRTKAAGVLDAVIEAAGDLDGKRVAVAAGERPELAGLEARLRDAGATLVVWKDEDGADRMFDADLGVTDVHCALAETGTLVCCSDGGHNRLASLAPPRHVAVVMAGDVVPDMLDFYATLEGKAGSKLPSSIAYITGPSKTADIEGILIKGVHGPGEVDIILVEDASPGD